MSTYVYSRSNIIGPSKNRILPPVVFAACGVIGFLVQDSFSKYKLRKADEILESYAKERIDQLETNKSNSSK